MSSDTKKAIVIGAGISGLASAVVLFQNGYQVTVYDKHPVGENIGGGLGIWPNGTKVLFDLLGIKQQVLDISGKISSVNIFDAHGKFELQNNIAYYQRSEDYPALFVSRQDLIHVLAHATEGKITIEQKTLANIVNSQGEIVVEFSDGTEEKASLLVGADGINSLVRETMYPGIVKKYLGHISLGGIVDISLPKRNFIYAPNKLCVTFPCGGDKSYAIMFMPKPENWLKSSCKTREEQLELFRGWSLNVDEILDKLAVEQYFCLESFGLPALPSYAVNSIYLVGDAAHAMTPVSGLGAALALEDVSALNDALALKSSDEYYDNQIQIRAKAFHDFCAKFFIAPLLNGSLESYEERMRAIRNISPEIALQPLLELTQPASLWNE